MATVIGSNATVRTVVRKRWTPESGEEETREFRGPPDKVSATYEATKTEAEAGDERFASLDYELANGRAKLIAYYARQGGSGGDVPMGSSANTSTIEELYGVDVVKDIRQHPKFQAGGEWALTDAQLQGVWDYYQKDVSDFETDGDGVIIERTAWTDNQKRLYRKLIHGEDSYLETAFILRRTVYGARNRRVKATFTNTNKVGEIQRLSVKMANLLDTLPVGEWLKKPSTCEYLTKGQWRVSEEYHWAEKWSSLYGGTLDWGP